MFLCTLYRLVGVGVGYQGKGKIYKGILLKEVRQDFELHTVHVHLVTGPLNTHKYTGERTDRKGSKQK